MLQTPDITVVVKAPNQKHGDHPVLCRRDWTVQQLKGHLSENYPSKPAQTEQRLIYSGQLLTDEVRLGDVLRRHDDDSNVHTVHLVCAAPAPTPAGGVRQRRPVRNQQQQQEQQQQQMSAPAATVQPSVSTDSAAGPASSGLPAQSLAAQWASLMQQQPGTQQMLAYQQMYAQYWTQYAQMMQQGAGSVPLLWPQMAAHQPQPPSQQPQPQPQPAARRQQPQNQNQNVRLNAQGGMMMGDDDDGNGQWDWLDWLHGCARMAVLFLAVYFYASVPRLVLVLGFGFLAYLYNQGWLQGPARPPAEPAAEPQQPPAEPAGPAEPADQPAPADDQQDQPDDQQERPDDQQERPVQVSEELRRVMDQLGVDRAALERPHPLTLAWTFFSSFFTSLIPDRIDQ